MKRIVLTVCAVAGLAVAVVAGDLSISQGWKYTKNGQVRYLPPAEVSWNLTGNGKLDNVQLVSTNILGDALVVGGVTTAGFFQGLNMGPVSVNTNGVQTNRVQIGALDSGGLFLPLLNLDTNQAAMTWLDTIALRARATGTNSVQLGYTITDR